MNPLFTFYPTPKYTKELKKPDFDTLRSNTFSYKYFGCKISNSKAPFSQNFILQKHGLINHRYELLQSTDVEEFVKYIAENKTRGAKAEADLVFSGAAVMKLLWQITWTLWMQCQRCWCHQHHLRQI